METRLWMSSTTDASHYHRGQVGYTKSAWRRMTSVRPIGGAKPHWTSTAHELMAADIA
ncbi:hypothetical protein bcgnr5379_61510 [Bacillus cereus]